MITRTSARSSAEVERNVHHLFLGVAQGRCSATAPEVVDHFFVSRGSRPLFQSFVFEVLAPQERLGAAVLERARLWTSFVASSSAEDERERAANVAILERALATPHVEAPVHEVPEPKGNLVRDVRAVTGLTNNDLAALFGVKERTIFNVQNGKPRTQYEPILKSLQAIGSILVPGLGPAGVKKWLTAGIPSRLDRIRNGEIEQVHEEARAYLR